jgi:alpha-beta hydrolase superfamily lysophospholipase
MLPTYPSAADARHEDGFLHSKDHTRLYWRRYTPEGARATVAVVPGGGDHSGRYPALAAALAAAGFEVALVDLRGHGQSDGRRWHVDAFDDYLDDVDAFLGHVRAGAAARRVFVLGHSMGALVAGTWALSRSTAGVAGFVFSSPYLKLKLEPPRLKVMGAKLVGRVVPWLPISTELKYADLTSDEELQRWTEADPLYGKATTPRWFVESQRAQAALLAAAPRFTRPLLVLTGGDDPIADPEAGARFLAAAGSADKELRRYPGLRHEIFNERERAKPIADVVAWITARADEPGAIRPLGR